MQQLCRLQLCRGQLNVKSKVTAAALQAAGCWWPLQSTQHTVTTHCRRAAARPPPRWPELPAEKKLSFLQKNKNANLAQAAVACKICVQSTKLLIRVGEGEECWDQNEDDTPFSADMQAMFNYVYN